MKAAAWAGAAVLLASLSLGSCVCHLDNYVSSCVLDILDEHIEATAVINYCHLPLDITFLIAFQYKNSTRHNWKYTFVTTNQNERVLIPGLLLPIAPHAPVFLSAQVPERVFHKHNASVVAIQASFIAELDTDRWEEADFLNHTVYIPSIRDCAFYKAQYATKPWIVGGLFITAMVLAAAGGGYLLYRRKKAAVDEMALVSAMEVAVPTTQPYQMDGSSEQSPKSNGPVDKGNGPDGHVEGSSDSTLENGHCTSDKTSEEENTRSGRKGFKFGRLKEEKVTESVVSPSPRDTSVIISNPVYQDSKSPHHQQEGRDNTQVPSNSNAASKDKNCIIENGNVNESFEEEEEGFPEKVEEGLCKSQEDKNGEEVVDDDLSLEYDNSENEGNGQQVGQGARRKVRGGTPSLTLPESPPIAATS